MSSPPLEGQVGVLHMDERVMRNEVVIRSRQQRQQQALSSLDESLLVSTASISLYDSNMKDEGVSGKRGGGRSKTTKTTEECVKFVGNVGSWAQEDRDKWFPEEGDVRDFLRALDNFCPISWLKEEAEAEVDDGNKDVVGGVGESGAGVYRVRVAGAGREATVDGMPLGR